ncbi:hypothetical protein Q6294_31580, partial [Klebsiella pneumoniae]
FEVGVFEQALLEVGVEERTDQPFDFALMGLQFAVAALIQHGQWVDRAIERQLAKRTLPASRSCYLMR